VTAGNLDVGGSPEDVKAVAAVASVSPRPASTDAAPGPPDVVGVILACASIAMAVVWLLGIPSAIGPLTIVYVVVCPGTALVRLARPNDRLLEILAGSALSIAIAGLLSVAELRLDRWSPSFTLAVLVATGLVGSALDPELRTAVGDAMVPARRRRRRWRPVWASTATLEPLPVEPPPRLDTVPGDRRLGGGWRTVAPTDGDRRGTTNGVDVPAGGETAGMQSPGDSPRAQRHEADPPTTPSSLPPPAVGGRVTIQPAATGSIRSHRRHDVALGNDPLRAAPSNAIDATIRGLVEGLAELRDQDPE